MKFSVEHERAEVTLFDADFGGPYPRRGDFWIEADLGKHALYRVQSLSFIHVRGVIAAVAVVEFDSYQEEEV